MLSLCVNRVQHLIFNRNAVTIGIAPAISRSLYDLRHSCGSGPMQMA
jgi:hypothetical protein